MRPREAQRESRRAGVLWLLLLLGGLLLVPFLMEVVPELWTTANRAQAAILSSVLAVLGTLISAIVGVLLFNREQRQREREKAEDAMREADREALRREEKDREKEDETWAFRRNLAFALRAEIRESAMRLREQFTHEAILAQLAADKANLEASLDDTGMPKGIAIKPNIIFDNHTDQIYDLRETVVRALVRYYQNDLYLNLYLERMSDGAFDGIAIDRRKMAVVFYRELGRETLKAALRAEAMLRGYLTYVKNFRKGSDTDGAARRVMDDLDDNDAIAALLDEEGAHMFKTLVELDDDDARNAYKTAIGL